MTEEIIIDGVNVAGCKYYKGKCMGYTHYCQIGCKECTDIGIKLCHYKQTERFKAKIARLEQENEKLKEENYQLHKHCQICENFIDGIPCKPLRDMDYDLQKVINQRDEYIKALEEIRELAKDIIENDVYENSDVKAEKILTKINEVLTP